MVEKITILLVFFYSVEGGGEGGAGSPKLFSVNTQILIQRIVKIFQLFYLHWCDWNIFPFPCLDLEFSVYFTENKKYKNVLKHKKLNMLYGFLTCKVFKKCFNFLMLFLKMWEVNLAVPVSVCFNWHKNYIVHRFRRPFWKPFWKLLIFSQ